MSAVAPPDTSHASPAAPKKKPNKKKKNTKAKSNGDAVGNLHSRSIDEGDGDPEVDDSEKSGVNTPIDSELPENTQLQVNGQKNDSTRNGHNSNDLQQSSDVKHPKGAGSDNDDASIRLEAMSQEREALRAEVEQLRKSLEDIQGRHEQDTKATRSQYEEALSEAQKNHSKEMSAMKEEHTEELTTIRTELEETEAGKEQAETQYQNLLGRVNTIKASLGERLKADKQELDEAKEQIEELESQNDALKKRIQGLESDIRRQEKEGAESSNELSSLRNRHNLSQQNWIREREGLVLQSKQLKEEAEAAKEAMGDWEVLAMEERSVREGLMERVRDLEEQFSSQKEAFELAVSERDSHSQTVDGLQRALQDVQDARKRELREMVESYEEQLKALKKLVQDSDSRAVEAEAVKISTQAELERLAPFEKEVKEKNLLIGKLRHEAIVLNDHLTKALRFLKKAKPEDNIDRQIVTNHFLHFLALDRSDPKKFQILQLIAALLNWTDEQKEQAGLARPGTSNVGLRLPISPFHRTPSSPSLSSEYFTESPATKESLAELWTGFLERSVDEGATRSTIGSRSGSVSSSKP